jgi:hypothetical protein
MITANQLIRTAKDFSRQAKEPVQVESTTGYLLVLGSELACLRLAYRFRHLGHAVTVEPTADGWMMRLPVSMAD